LNSAIRDRLHAVSRIVLALAGIGMLLAMK